MSERGGDPPCWAHLFDDPEHSGHGLGAPVVADLGAVTVRGNGAVWSLPHGGDLDANLVRLQSGGHIGEHVNDDVDVLMFVQSGGGHVRLGDVRVDLAPDHLVLVPRGERRAISAGPNGITYLSVHRRRDPLGIKGSTKGNR